MLLIVLVAGLLRSHAEILRRLGPGDQEARGAPPLTEPVGPRGSEGTRGSDGTRRSGGTRAAAISGTTLDGDAVTLDFAGGAGAPTLLAFLSSGCSTCAGFWERLGERRLPEGVQTVIVTHGVERELPARLRSLAPHGVPVVLSSPAWTDYGIPGAPYFVLVHGAIRGEGAATSWEALASLVTDAIEDQRQARGREVGPSRARQIDERFAAAGIGPDHPSLYPSDE